MKNKKLYVAICLFILFVINTILVVTGIMVKIDQSIHNLVMHMHSEISTNIMKIFTFFGSTIFIVVLTIIIFSILFWNNKKLKAYCTFGIIVISTILNNLVKIIVRRPRPEYITVIENTFSYPSGHMMASTSLYGFLIYLIIKSNMVKKYKCFYVTLLSILISLVGTSRIYLGAHFFSDIFGGLLLSLSLLFLFAHLNSKKKFI